MTKDGPPPEIEEELLWKQSRPIVNLLEDVSRRTDNGNATAFITAFGHVVRYVPTWRKWLVWDGKRWRMDDDSSAVTDLARRFAYALWDELARIASGLGKQLSAVASFVRSTNQNHGIESMLSLARCDQRIVVQHDQLNANPYFLNALNGTIDLVTGALHPHSPQDHITQLARTKFDADADAVEWKKTITLIFDGDQELIRYCQQLLGYSVSGDIGEAILPICYGSGANGKSTVWNAIVELLGDYGFVAPSKLLMGSSNEHATEVASLYQKRLVCIAEPEQNAKLREARVKELTGDATITARRMREDFWSFDRTHKFWMASNHLPQIQGGDEGIWRRVKLIPFTVDLRQRIEPKPNFHKWLVENEGPGILNWLIEGFRDYRENGFIEPQTVKNATGGYREQSDQLGQFIADRCIIEPSACVSSNELYRQYEDWGGQLSQTKFSMEMATRFKKEKRTFGPYRMKQVFEGIGLLSGVDY